MSKELNHNEVLESIQKKIELKKRLRVAKKNTMKMKYLTSLKKYPK